MGNESERSERLAALEAKVDLLTDVIVRLEAKLDAYQANFVPRAEYNEKVRELAEDIKELREERKQARLQMPNWLLTVIAVASLGVSIYFGGKK